MLVLSRKLGERIVVPDCDLAVTVLAVDGNRVRLGISAPPEIGVYREEIWHQIDQQAHSPLPKVKDALGSGVSEEIHAAYPRRLPLPAIPQERSGQKGLTLKRPFMIDNRDLASDGDTFLGSVAAELTVAAYPIALRHGLKGLWLDLEIDLWMVLAKTVQKWFQQAPRFEWPGDSGSEREDFLAELTDAAYRTTLKYRVQGSFLDLELGLYHAFSQMVQDGV